MPSFEVSGTGPTGRKRKRTYHAHDLESAKAMASNDGTTIEGITELPPDPATEAQRAYATSLGQQYPDDISKDDMSDLIRRAVSRDRPPSPRHVAIA